jgi:hypothetical protein
MPYIITSRAPARSKAWHYSRRAVATLDEAQRAAVDIIEDQWKAANAADYDTATSALYSEAQTKVYATIQTTGGTIGPLSDGTVVTVERVTDYEAATAAGLSAPHTRGRAEIIDAYNAAAK